MKQDLRELLSRLEQLTEGVRELSEGVRQAVDIADRDPEMALTRARKVLEFIVRDIYERRIGKPAGTQPLDNLLKLIAKEGHFPPRLAAYANSVKDLGNVGTHSFDERFSAQDVLRSLGQLLPIVEWYFEQEKPAVYPASARTDEPSTMDDPRPLQSSSAATHVVQPVSSTPLSRQATPLKRHVLLDRRLATELTMLLAGPEITLRGDLAMSALLPVALALFDQLLVENVYGSSLAALLHKREGLLRESILMVRTRGADSDEIASVAADAGRVWSGDGKFQLAASTYDRKKGGATGAIDEHVDYLQQALLQARHLDAALLPHPDRWPLFQCMFERCLWCGDDFACRLALPENLSDPAFGIPPGRLAGIQQALGDSLPSPALDLARFGPMPFPFPSGLLKQYDLQDLASFPPFVFEFIVPASRPTVGRG